MNECCFSLDFVPIAKFISNWIVHRIQIGTIWRATIIVNKWWKILSTPFRCSMMRVWILFKEPVESKSFIGIFEWKGKDLFHLNSMIDCAFIENEQRRYALGRGSIPFCLCLMPSFFSAWARSLDRFHNSSRVIWKENCRSVLFPKICSKSICKCFSVWSFDHWKAMVRLLSSRDVTVDPFSLFAEHFSGKCR